ncbi:MAG: trypsin-like serine protease [Polyangiales bacterium]
MNYQLFVLLTLFSILAGDRTARADEVDSRGEYIVNGSPTETGDLRGTVALLSAPEVKGSDDLPRQSLWTHFRCSAVLIAPSVVVTAAHCVEVCGYETCELPDGETFECYRCESDPLPANSLYIATGLRTVDDVWSVEIKGVHELVVHEGYAFSDQWRVDAGVCEQRGDGLLCEKPGLATDLNDIALLLLEGTVTVEKPVQLLPGSDDIVGEIGTAQGYGLRVPPEYEGLLDQQEYASLLNETSTPIEQVTDQEILTAEGPHRSGTCYGDSGGPLYVQRGSELFVAGIFSRFRLDVDGPYCGRGAIYTSAPSYLDWIYEKAPEAIPGGGGCSASSNAQASNGTWLAGLLALVLFARARRGALVVGAIVLVGAPSFGCGSDGGGDPSFCNDKYDPSGDFCDPSVHRIDLRTAERMARNSMPNEALLWSALGGAEGTVNPDGEAEAWFLQYYIPGKLALPDALLRSVTVYVSKDLQPYQEIGTVQCIPTEPMILVDSKEIVHDAIRRLEDAGVTVRLGERGLIRVVQSHRCARAPDEWGGVGFANSFVYYSDDGTFLSMEGAP